MVLEPGGSASPGTLLEMQFLVSLDLWNQKLGVWPAGGGVVQQFVSEGSMQ